MNNKLYISGRITGIKYPTAVRNFAHAQRYWERKGYKVVNPINLCKQGWNWYICMAICLYHLLWCKYVYMLPNYKRSRGAMIEYKVAKKLGKIIYKNGNR